MSSSTSHRDFAALEQRRLQAVDHFAAGTLRSAEIARQLRVSRQSVSRWYAQWRRGGRRALRAAGRAGRKPRLTSRQLKNLAQGLRKSPRLHGLQGDCWTLPRVAELIERATGVKYHPGHVWKMLCGLKWEGSGLTEADLRPGSGRWLAIKRALKDK